MNEVVTSGPWWRSSDWWRSSPLAQRDTTTLVVLALLLVVDIGFILLTALDFQDVLDLDETMLVTTDQSWPERWGYLQLAAAAAALWVGARGDLRVGRLALGGTLVVLLADDALRLHEDLGRELAEAADFPAVAGLRVKDLGELVIYGVLAVVILGLLVLAHRRTPERERWFPRAMTVGLVVLAAVSVGGDLFAEATAEVSFIEGQWALEDGGELLMMSVLAALVLRLRRDDRDDADHRQDPGRTG